MIEIYWASGSCNSWCVLLTLAIKRVPYASKILQLSQREHKSSEYLALNPRGKVPCIRDNGYVLYESLAIILYLDRKYPDPPMYGESPAQAGRIAQLASESRCYVEPKIDALVVPIYRGKTAEQRDELVGKAAALHEELARFEAMLSEGDYLAGPRPSTADVVLFPMLQHVRRAVARPDAQALDLGFQSYAERYPRLEAWNARIESIPGYELTYPPHWK
jgi:glutathione S-transferase